MKNKRKLNEEVISCIEISMLDLLKVKDFDTISIIDIIEHAGVSRNSFYRNFKNKEDILIRYIECITDEFIEAASIHVFEVSWTEYIEAILKHMYENKNFVMLLMKNNKLHLIKNIFDKAIYTRASGKTDDYHIWFLSGGLFNIHQHWAENGYKELPKDIAEKFDRAVLGI
ncbi:MAG: TetR/AcrR family transcriptional regulator [Treponemataceae bacterium]|nr:TetR/AcrR family transcriptional regulator [Treponemataceae bacterium]